MSIHPVIMAGGRGTRFWPLSRESLPKQFLTVAGEESLLQRTARRLYPLAGEGRVWVVTNGAHVDLAASHLPEVSRDRIVGEPAGRNTAPCVALAAALVAREDPDGVLLVAPADHWIADEEGFRDRARVAVEFAERERALVTFGIVPTAPETGYGYIEVGEEAADGVRAAARFLEKPDRATAEKFVASGRHLWNSGIFAWRADVFLEELEKFQPDIAGPCRRMGEAPDPASVIAETYAGLPSISVDYAVLEHSEKVFCVPSQFGWSDVGSWDALGELFSPDESGNVIQGDGLAVDSSDCLLVSPHRLTAVLGVKDLLVVDTPDAVLVCPKNRAQDVKSVVEQLEKRGRRAQL